MSSRPPNSPVDAARPAVGAEAAVAGIAGGILGTVAMGLFQMAWTSAVEPPRASRRLKHAGRGLRQPSQSEPRSHEKPLSTSELLVEKAARHALDARPSQRQRELLGSAFHYTFGATAGAIYGALARRHPRVSAGHGTLYGLAVWLVADELLVPALRIADPPWRSPLRLHLYAIGAHLVYGLVLESGRRMIRRPSPRSH